MEDPMVKVILGAIQDLEARLESFSVYEGEFDTISQKLKSQAVYLYTPADFLVDGLFEAVIKETPATRRWSLCHDMKYLSGYGPETLTESDLNWIEEDRLQWATGWHRMEN